MNRARVLVSARNVLLISAATALVAGCGGSQPPIGAPGAMPQSHTNAEHAAHGKSWMLPEAKSDDLLYVSTPTSNVFVYSYPRLKLVGELEHLNYQAGGLCSDSNGNVFIPTYSQSVVGSVFKFAHGGSTPIAILGDPGAAIGCSVDPTTGNLGVVNSFDLNQPRNSADLAVYASAQGTPTLYTDHKLSTMYSCSYDADGDLFVDSYYGPFRLAELARGSSRLVSVRVKGITSERAPIQWDGNYLAVTEFSNEDDKLLRIARVKVSGSFGKITGTTRLRSRQRFYGLDWIQGDTVIDDNHNGDRFGLWHYPQGGRSFRNGKVHYGIPWGMTVSLAAPR